MNIVIGADIVPTESNYMMFSGGDSEQLVGHELKQYLESCSFRIFNLEIPLTDNKNPILKCGPNLIAPSSTVKGYRALNIDLLTLANNHIMDQGITGLVDTMQLLQENNINYLGAGINIEEARRPYVFEMEGKRIGVYACAEHEFSIANSDNGGANPYDPLTSFDHVLDLKKKCDYLIVLYHGGKEFYRYPSPELQRRCRKFIEKGADLVVCQHSHCIGCEENYLSGKIVYGQGNFLFDHGNDEYWNSSILININFDKTGKHLISYIPLCKNGATNRYADNAERDLILRDFYARSEKIMEPGFIKHQYTAFAEKKLNGYYAASLGVLGSSIFGRLLSRVFRRKLWKHFYRNREMLCLRNFIECEAHSELFIEGLKASLNGDMSVD